MAKVVGKGSRHGSTPFGRLGDGAKHPPAWVGVAAALALTGPRGRRAGLRGGACYAAAGLAQAVIKPLIGRERPKGSGWLRLGPMTSSFPSGHAASDLAFVLGASQEAPFAFLVLSPVTVAVHWSLIRSRGHYPSDVLAGGLLGIAVAAAAWQVWPPKAGRGAPPPVLSRRLQPPGSGAVTATDVFR
ncbi:MAG TPA: phosphatase PAP2 family protein [Egibacteraceae bacterium]|nr:phosphatase PAP2 family protein [Egibacteraceae bacterium]